MNSFSEPAPRRREASILLQETTRLSRRVTVAARDPGRRERAPRGALDRPALGCRTMSTPNGSRPVLATPAMDERDERHPPCCLDGGCRGKMKDFFRSQEAMSPRVPRRTHLAQRGAPVDEAAADRGPWPHDRLACSRAPHLMIRRPTFNSVVQRHRSRRRVLSTGRMNLALGMRSSADTGARWMSVHVAVSHMSAPWPLRSWRM